MAQLGERPLLYYAAVIIEPHCQRGSWTLWSEIKIEMSQLGERPLYNNEPRHEISNNVVCATSKASDQPAHTRSLGL